MAQPKVASEVARRLMREASERGLKPGDHLGAESWLIERYGVARGSLREALRLLEKQGAVEMRRGAGGGAMMAQPQPAQLAGFLAMTLQSDHGNMRTILEARSAFEPTMAALAAQKRTPEQLAQLRKCTSKLMLSRNNSAAFHLCNRQFHDLVAVASGNIMLAAISSAVSWMSGTTGWEIEAKARKRVATGNRQVGGAIEDRDSLQASQRMSRVLLDYEKLVEADPAKLNVPVVWADVDELLERYLSKDNEAESA